MYKTTQYIKVKEDRKYIVEKIKISFLLNGMDIIKFLHLNDVSMKILLIKSAF